MYALRRHGYANLTSHVVFPLARRHQAPASGGAFRVYSLGARHGSSRHVIVGAMAPSDPAHRPATYDDLLALPEHVVGEIIDGELHVSPRPAPRHAHVSSVLGGELGPPFHGGRGGPGGWWVLDEPELHFREDVLVPDLAGWGRSRMPALPATAYFPLAPDWVCEVLSPTTTRLDRLKKLRVYARERVGHAWLIDPAARTLEILRLEGDLWSIVAVQGGNDVIHAEPFEAIALDLSLLWPDAEGA